MTTMIDDRYLEGVWYDAGSGDFCRIRVRDGEVILVTPDGDDEYYTLSPDEFNDEQMDFYRVDPEAVLDPEAYYEEAVASMLDPNQELPYHDHIAFQYADERTEVVLRED